MTESIMIGKEDELSMDEVMTPVFDSLNVSIKLNVISTLLWAPANFSL